MTDFLSFKAFHVSVERQARGGLVARTVIRVAGEVDVATSTLLAAAVARAMETGAAGRTELVVDLAQVRFIDASGVNVLLSATSRARSADRTLVLRSPSRAVRRMLDVLRLDGVLAVE
jgi:anti-anti-sigma factor